jgi:DNA-binding LytR/AlgR family response regulator
MKTYQQKGNQELLILNHKTLKKVLIANVVLLEGSINYTILYMQDGKTKLLSHTLKFFETFLKTHGFLRVHRSCLINPNYVQHYNQEQEILTMTNGYQANISRRRKHELRYL